MLRECFSLWLSGISADEEAWWMHNADTQCTVEGTEEDKEKRQNFMFNCFSCLAIKCIFYFTEVT